MINRRTREKGGSRKKLEGAESLPEGKEMPKQQQLSEEVVKKSQGLSYEKVVSCYIDIINEHGINSKKAKEYRKIHSDDKELAELLKTAGDVKVMFVEGELD